MEDLYAVVINNILIDSYLSFEEAQSVLDEYEFTIVDDNSGIVPMDEING